MSILKFDETPFEQVKQGLTRKLIHTSSLMTVIVEFSNGPWVEPEPPHSHPHEQTTYVARGEIVFYCENQPDVVLKEGDMFSVPSGKMHTIKLLTSHARLIDSFTPIRNEFLQK